MNKKKIIALAIAVLISLLFVVVYVAVTGNSGGSPDDNSIMHLIPLW